MPVYDYSYQTWEGKRRGATMRVHSQRVSKSTAILGALCMAVATLWSSVGKAETQVYLLRGWFGNYA